MTAGIQIILLAVLSLPLLVLFSGGFDIDSGYARIAFEKTAITVALSAAVAFFSVVVGGFAGVALSFFKIPFGRFFVLSFAAPIIAPSYVFAMLYSDVSSLFLSNFGYVFVMANVGSAYCFLLSYNAANAVSSEMVASLEVLGMGWGRILRKAILPALFPAFVSGAVVAFADSFGEFGTAIYTGADTVVALIYRLHFGGYLYDVARTVAFSVFALTLVAVFAVNRIGNDAIYQSKTGFSRRKAKYSLTPRATLAVTAALSVFSLAFVGVPLATLARWFFVVASKTDYVELLSVTLQSVLLAAVCAAVTVFVCLVILEGSGKRLLPLTRSVLGNNYFIPGIIVAIAVLTLTKEWEFLREWTWAGLVLAILMKHIAIPFNLLHSNQIYLNGGYEGLVSTYGKSKAWYLFRVKYPLLWRGMVLSGLIIFLKVVKELPLTMVLRPFGFETLATKAYHLASAETLYLCAPWIVMILALSLTVTLVVHRLSK